MFGYVLIAIIAIPMAYVVVQIFIDDSKKHSTKK
jgi:hypothetical protein